MNPTARFDTRKYIQLKKKDRSDKGKIDAEIASLVNAINQSKEHYTTSSCSGRIILIKEKDVKEPQLFLFRTHHPSSFRELKKALQQAVKKYKGMIYLKQEAVIMHIISISVAKAQELMNKAQFLGWRRSGIIATQKRAVAELLSTENMAVPVADKGRILASDEYLKVIIREANKKLKRTREKIKKLEKAL